MSTVVISLLLGISLSATCGFRVFVPPLILAIFYKLNLVTLPVKYEWVKSDLALTILAIATIIEILAYYIPIIDNMLDTISIPTSFVAGTLMLVTFVNFDSEILNWSLSVIAGGGAAVSISILMSTLRVVSTTVTLGIGNWIFSTLEWVGATVLSVITILLPIIAIFLLVSIFIALNYLRIKKKKLIKYH